MLKDKLLDRCRSIILLLLLMFLLPESGWAGGVVISVEPDPSLTDWLTAFFGRFHLVVLHFPIVLLIMAFLIEAVAFVKPGKFLHPPKATQDLSGLQN